MEKPIERLKKYRTPLIVRPIHNCPTVSGRGQLSVYGADKVFCQQKRKDFLLIKQKGTVNMVISVTL